MSYKGACGHKEACPPSERLINMMRIELFSLLCLHSFHTGAEVKVHVQLKLTLIVGLKVGFSQESVRVKTFHASPLLPSGSLTHPQVMLEAAQQVPSRVQHWKTALVSLDARNIPQNCQILSHCVL